MQLFCKIATAQTKSPKDFLRLKPSRTPVVLVLRVSYSYRLLHTGKLLLLTLGTWLKAPHLNQAFHGWLSHPVERDGQTKDIKIKCSSYSDLALLWLPVKDETQQDGQQDTHPGMREPSSRRHFCSGHHAPCMCFKKGMWSGYQHSPLPFQWRQLIPLHWTWWYENKQIDNAVISLIGNVKGAGLLGLYQVTQFPAREALYIFFSWSFRVRSSRKRNCNNEKCIDRAAQKTCLK